ncbi:FhaA domain-containing protein [Mitsuokella sp.]|uniref:FhaA domain-containing protein n=1 Tax=Mitsuokella TaxID=52225 RepID=UPI0029E76183|nr:FhaA domain-containing protein [Mitsuokella sp.]MDD6383678.1 DUF3662 domain-containing protein [Selenomonadaceae bacterium]MDY4473793.1 FhaA domain-containing protein [Mitsuokella sp.]
MGLGTWESYLTNHIEGFFNKRFSSNLEVAELMNGIEKEVARQASGAGTPVGNVFDFYLCPDDYHRLCAQRIIDALCTTAGRQVILQDCTMEGKLTIRMKQSRKLSRGMYKLRCSREDEVEEPDNTLVLERPRLDESRPLSLPAFHPLASLTVVEGPDRDAYLELGEKQIYIGRRDKNEFILTDAKASRLHAWISYEHHRHELHDAQSTNGTFVEGERIATCRLQHGDTIRIGVTILRYEVI